MTVLYWQKVYERAQRPTYPEIICRWYQHVAVGSSYCPENSIEQHYHSIVVFVLNFFEEKLCRTRGPCKVFGLGSGTRKENLKVCQIHETGCCNQDVHRGERAFRSDKFKRLLDFIWPFPKFLGKDCSCVRNAMLLSLYLSSFFCFCFFGSVQNDGRKKEKQNRMTSLFSSHSSTFMSLRWHPLVITGKLCR